MKYSRQPQLETTASPGRNSWARDSMTAPPSRGLPAVGAAAFCISTRATGCTRNSASSSATDGTGFLPSIDNGQMIKVNTMATTTVTQIPVGTLLIDLVDAKKKELVWRGVASDTLNTDPNRTAEDREKKLRAVAAEMFAGYPPKK